MKILSSTRRVLGIAGFLGSNSVFNLRQTLIIVTLILGMLSTIIFVILQNSSRIADYTDNLYIAIYAFSFLCTYSSLIWQKAKVIQFIQDFEEIINNRRESVAPIYAKANYYVELCAKIPIYSVIGVAIAYYALWAVVNLIIISRNDYLVDLNELIFPFKFA